MSEATTTVVVLLVSDPFSVVARTPDTAASKPPPLTFDPPARMRQAVDALSSLVEASDVTVGKWLSAAQDDKDVCAEMKDDIKVWFDALDAAIREGVKP